MLHNKTKVNMTNKTGATALHFASLNGHDLLVELILSHSGIDTVSVLNDHFISSFRPSKISTGRQH